MNLIHFFSAKWDFFCLPEICYILYKRDKAYIMVKFKGMIIALDKKELKGMFKLHANLDHLFMLSVQENFIIK